MTQTITEYRLITAGLKPRDVEPRTYPTLVDAHAAATWGDELQSRSVTIMTEKRYGASSPDCPTGVWTTEVGRTATQWVDHRLAKTS
jgi:hypothetical protein